MVGVLFCDQSAAFDLCDHDILIEKLRLMGVEDTALNWIRSYLSNRKQSCLVDGEMSPSRIVAYHRAVLEGHCCGYALPVTNLTLFMYTRLMARPFIEVARIKGVQVQVEQMGEITVES